MKIFGSISELVSIVFRLSGGKTVNLLAESQTSSASTVTVKIPDIEASSAPSALPSASEDRMLTEKAKQAMTNKTLTSPTITGASLTGVSLFSLDDTDSAYNLAIQSSSTLAANRTLTIDVNDGTRTLDLSGNLTLGKNLSVGTGNLTLNGDVGGSSNISFPAGTRTAVTTDSSQTLTNKTIDGDDNTIQDLGLSSIKVSLSDANKALVRDISGNVASAFLVNANVSSSAAIEASKIVAGAAANKMVVTGDSGILQANTNTVNANKALITDVNGLPASSTTTATEIGYVSGVTSAIQTQIDAKQATITGGASSITSINLTTSRALASDESGKVVVSATTSTELGYVSGVTSAIQTQLNNKVTGNASITGATKTKITYDSKGLVTAGADAAVADISGLQTALDAKVAGNVAITGATKTKITYDSKGLVTAGADLAAGDLPSGIDAAKIGTGLVSNTEFGYLDGVTSAIQTQIDGKQATITGAATTITSSNLTASKALASDASGKVAASSATSTELGYLSGVTSAVQTQLDGKLTSNTAITGATKTKITYDSKGLVTAGADLAAGDLPSGIDAIKIGTGVVSNTEFGYLDGVTSAVQTQIDGKQATITGGATTITSSNLTTSRALSSDVSGKVAVSATTSTELGYLSGVTSAVQTQIDGKQATITGGATTITSSNLTASKALASDASGKVAASSVTSTELGYVSGVTSAIQTQLGNKAASGANTDITSLQGVTLNGHQLNSGSATIATSTLTPVVNKSLQVIATAANFGMIANPVAGQEYVLINESASDITIANLSGATAANQIYTGTGADYVFKAKSAIPVIYDGSLTKWFLVLGAGAGSITIDGSQVVSGTVVAARLPTAGAAAAGIVSTTAQTFGGAKTFQDGLVFASSSLSDSQATLMGLKQYLHGTTYNSGIAPTVTSAQAGFSVVRAVFVPYQMQDGAWRLRFNLVATFTSASISTITVSVNGITNKNVVNFSQAISTMFQGNNNIGRGFANENTSSFRADLPSAITAAGLNFSGDVELNSKPTWAY